MLLTADKGTVQYSWEKSFYNHLLLNAFLQITEHWTPSADTTFGFLSSYFEAFEFSLIVLDLIPKIITTSVYKIRSLLTDKNTINQSIN